MTANECASVWKPAVDPRAPTSAGRHGAVNGRISARHHGVGSYRQARILLRDTLGRPQPSRPRRGRAREVRKAVGGQSEQACGGGAVREISLGQSGDNRGRVQSPEGEGPTQRGGGGDDCRTRARMVGFERGQRVRGHPGNAGWAAQGRHAGRLREVGRQKQVHGARHCRKQELRAGKAGGSRARQGMG